MKTISQEMVGKPSSVLRARSKKGATFPMSLYSGTMTASDRVMGSPA